MIAWTCPTCAQLVDNGGTPRRSTLLVDIGLRHRAVLETFDCPNPGCGQTMLEAAIFQRDSSLAGDDGQLGTLVERRQLIPASRARAWTDDVPVAVRAEYEEACRIESASPKASAAFSRRCLQAILRDYFAVANPGLFDAIAQIEGRESEEVLLAALHALRGLETIGTNPARDPGSIIDVAPGEATLMIDLIETVIEETYVARRRRAETLARLERAAAEKAAAEKAAADKAAAEKALAEWAAARKAAADWALAEKEAEDWAAAEKAATEWAAAERAAAEWAAAEKAAAEREAELDKPQRNYLERLLRGVQLLRHRP